MSKPLVTFPDPEKAVIDHLVSEFAGRTESYVPGSIGIGFPDGDGYHVQVELEVGNVDDYPVTERAQVRVTCWAPEGRRSDVKDLASLTQGLLYGHRGDSDVAGASIMLGRSDVITDDDSRRLMCWFLARVTLKPTVLAHY